MAKGSENIFLWDNILVSLDIKPEQSWCTLFFCGATKYWQFQYQTDWQNLRITGATGSISMHNFLRNQINQMKMLHLTMLNKDRKNTWIHPLSRSKPNVLFWDKTHPPSKFGGNPFNQQMYTHISTNCAVLSAMWRRAQPLMLAHNEIKYQHWPEIYANMTGQ